MRSSRHHRIRPPPGRCGHLHAQMAASRWKPDGARTPGGGAALPAFGRLDPCPPRTPDANPKELQLPATARPAWTLGAVCLATFMLLLDVSVVVALPSMRADLGGTFADAQWVLDAYTLALAGLIMVGAVLADRLGPRRIFAAGVAVFTLASGACALADAPLVLNVGRAVQGSAEGWCWRRPSR